MPTQHSTLAAYRLLDALRERYPQLTIQTTSLDLAMATRAVADLSSDSTARYADFAGLVQLLPPGLVWQPALDEPDDATSSAYRAISAFFGRLGLGIDLRKQTPGNLRSIHRWLALYKRFRALLHSGTTVRSDESDRGFLAHGVVAVDRDEALFALVWLERALASRRIRIDGLDPATSYRIEAIGARPGEPQTVTPSWAARSPVLTGQALGAAGLFLPPARRGSALLLHLQWSPSARTRPPYCSRACAAAFASCSAESAACAAPGSASSRSGLACLPLGGWLPWLRSDSTRSACSSACWVAASASDSPTPQPCGGRGPAPRPPPSASAGCFGSGARAGSAGSRLSGRLGALAGVRPKADARSVDPKPPYVTAWLSRPLRTSAAISGSPSAVCNV